MERYLLVNLLGPGPRLIKKEFTGTRSHKGWETLVYVNPGLSPLGKNLRYPLNWGLNGPKTQSGRFGEEEKPFAPTGIRKLDCARNIDCAKVFLNRLTYFSARYVATKRGGYWAPHLEQVVRNFRLRKYTMGCVKFLAKRCGTRLIFPCVV